MQQRELNWQGTETREIARRTACGVVAQLDKSETSKEDSGSAWRHLGAETWGPLTEWNMALDDAVCYPAASLRNYNYLFVSELLLAGARQAYDLGRGAGAEVQGEISANRTCRYGTELNAQSASSCRGNTCSARRDAARGVNEIPAGNNAGYWS